MSFHSAGHTARKFGARRRLLCSASIAALILSPLPALAQQFTWGGAGSSTTTPNYNTVTNWSGNTTAPTVAGQSALFTSTGNISVIVASSITADSWTFDSGSQSYGVGFAGSGQFVTFGGSGITDNASGQTISIGSTIGGTGGIAVNDATGKLVLSGTNNSYSGATSIAAGGTLTATSSLVALSPNSAFTVNGTLDLNGNSSTILSLAGASTGLVTDSATNTPDTLTITGGSLATPFAGVIQDGAGTSLTSLTIQGALSLSNTNTYTGVTTISSGGKLALTGAGAIPNSSSVSNFGTFDVSGITPGSTASIITLSGNNSAIVAIGGNTLSLSNASSFYSGSITGTSISTFKIAGGTENFTGNASAFAGTINIASGAFLALGTGASLGAGAITDNGFLNLNGGSGTTTLSNAISGTGQIIQGGAATYILTGTNSYTTTTINAGTLQIGNGGTSGSLGSGTVTFGGAATLIFNLSGNVTVANLITGGAGSLTQAGSGTLILTNTNSYGATTINSGGTIQVGGGGTTGTLGSGTVTDNGSLIFNKTSISTFSSSISGTGSLTQAGTGLLNLSNASTYSGSTTINPGTTLQLGDGGSIASSSGLTDNGVFDISVTIASSSTIKSLAGSGSVTMGTGAFPKSLTITAGAGTFTGVISGGGAVTISGGTETFNSAQTYTGGTTIASGASLVLGASGSLAGSTVDNGTLGYGATGTTTITSFAGITGSGGIAEVGGGTLIVNTQSPLTGTSAVTSGILIVGDINNPTASLAGGVLVGSLGTLEGHGTVKGAVTVVSGGTVKAGASIGTLTVNGAVSLPAGTTFIEEFSNTAGSKLAASGAVTLGGALKLVSDSTTYTSGTDYQFITGSSVSSTFSSVTGSPSGYTSTIQYSATAVDLILNPVAATPAAAAPAATPAVITTFLLNTYGQTPNQIAAGSALTASAFNAPLYVAVGNVVTANTAAVPTTLGQLAGDIHPSLRSAVIEDAMVRDTMLGHMHRDPDGPILWGAGFGNFGNISDSNAINLSHRSSGFLVGGDLPVAATGNDLRLGLSGGYSTGYASTAGNFSKANGHEGHVGGYLSYTADAVHFYLGDDYGFGSVNIARAVSTLGAVLTDSQSQHSNQLFGELGYRVSWDIPLEPYLGIANVSSGQGAFTEAGGIAALSGAAASDSEAFTTLGLRSDLGDPMSWGDASVTPHIDLGWQHALQKLTPSQLVTYQNTGQSFLVLGVPLSRDAAKVKAGIEVNQGPVKLFLDYDGEFASRVSENGISGGIDWQF